MSVFTLGIQAIGVVPFVLWIRHNNRVLEGITPTDLKPEITFPREIDTQYYSKRPLDNLGLPPLA